MILSYFTIENYRSITTAYKLDLSQRTVLLGKNNMGKTNIIKAINLGMKILNNIGNGYFRNGKIHKFSYDWRLDYPVDLQKNRRLKKKTTSIRMDFELTDVEKNELVGGYYHVGCKNFCCGYKTFTQILQIP